jgi:hypothetical protein
MSYEFDPNPEFRWDVTFVGRERQPVVIVDDFLRAPDSMVRYACEQARFGPSPLYYPGVVAPTPPPYVASLASGLARIVPGLFGVRLPPLRVVTSFYAIVTLPPDQLLPIQRRPHTDSSDPGQIAILHYLCDSSQGGTAFYRFRPTGYESLDEQRKDEMVRLIEEDADSHGPSPAEYITADNRLFEQTAQIEARFNRVLVYRSRVLHSGQFGSQTIRDPDPRVGRLTTNTFVLFRSI